MENKRYHIIAAAVLFALLTWISVNLRDEYTVVKQLPVVLENMKEGKALRHPIPKNVIVRFRGNGWSLAGLYLARDIKYFIDMSSIGSEEFVISGRDLFEHIKLPVALQVVDVKPESVFVSLADYREKHVPIIPRLVFNFHEGYGQVGRTAIIPDSVAISGAENLLAQAVAWPTIYKKFDNLRSPINEDIPLEEPTFYSVEPLRQLVRVQVNVQPFAEKTLTGIPLIATGVPQNREVIFIPPKMDLIVRGGIDQLAPLTDADFTANINYQTLLMDSSDTVVPTISGIPEIKIVGRKPERFQFIIRKRL